MSTFGWAMTIARCADDGDACPEPGSPEQK
jgi:hypothetical protein